MSAVGVSKQRAAGPVACGLREISTMAIVCAFDFSPYSMEALEAAAALARASDTELRAVYVYDLVAKHGSAFDVDVAGRAGHLHALRAELRRVGADPDAARVIVGRTVHVLLEQCQHDVRLIVIGAHGAGRARSLGSVAAALATSSPIPVLVVRNAVPIRQAAEHETELSIDVACGDDASSAAALGWAKDLAHSVPAVVRAVRSVLMSDHRVNAIWDRSPLAEELAIRAARDRAGLIVIGRSERRGLSRLRRPAVRSMLDHAITNVACVPATFELHATV